MKAVTWEDRDGADVFSLSRDTVGLEGLIRKWRDVRLIILDPVSAYLGGAESYNNADIRRVLAPLQELAERTGVAVLAISHLTKRAAASVMYRAMGSLAFVSAARAVWAAVPDRAAAGRMLLLPVKCNLAGSIKGMAYRILPHPANPALPTVAWEPEPVAMTAQEAMEIMPNPTPRERAAEWLKQALAAGALPSSEVERQAREAGFTLRTLRRAKTGLDILSYREGTGWMWRLPDTPGGAPAITVDLRAEHA